MIFAGDTHGILSAFRGIDEHAREGGEPVVIQVGDFGVLFAPECEVADYFRTREGGPIWITCGGNHDNWPLWRTMPEVELFGGKVRELAPGCFFADRGTLLTMGQNKILFFGGAESTDKHMRVPGDSWWEEESPSYSEFTQFFEAMETHKPNIVVTHDAPVCVPVLRHGNRGEQPTPRGLDNVFSLSAHKPARWYFGHHHHLDSWIVGETEFHCCGLNGEWRRPPTW